MKSVNHLGGEFLFVIFHRAIQIGLNGRGRLVHLIFWVFLFRGNNGVVIQLNKITLKYVGKVHDRATEASWNLKKFVTWLSRYSFDLGMSTKVPYVQRSTVFPYSWIASIKERDRKRIV